MRDRSQLRIERSIAQCRILLSIAAPLAVYLDPTVPILVPPGSLSGAAFFIDPLALGVMLVHLAYSVALLAIIAGGKLPLERVATIANFGDVLFGALVAVVTEGTNSPFYTFFLFAVLAAGLRGNRRTTEIVTGASLALYVGLILVARPDGFGFYLTRTVYLAITGYLAGFLGQQRRNLDTSLRDLTRTLHDGYAQALAGVNLRVETCRQLLRRGRADDAFTELTELQVGVNREYDALRAVVRSLRGLEVTPSPAISGDPTRFSVSARLEGSLPLVEHALQIMLEGARNVSRHAHAEQATIAAGPVAGRLVIEIRDDGVGFPADAPPPWSITSRAEEVGGRVSIEERDDGGKIVVELPLP